MDDWRSGEDEVSGIGDAHGGREGRPGETLSVQATEKGGGAISLVLLKRVASLRRFWSGGERRWQRAPSMRISREFLVETM
jgi:hypothetical protein